MKKVTSLLLISILTILQITLINTKIFAAESKEQSKAELIVEQVSNLKLPGVKGISDKKWSSLNSKIAEVNKSGEVTASAPGQTSITCSYKIKNRSYQYKWIVTVDDVPQPFRYKLAVHALGGLEDKYIYNNALEGLEQSTQNGYKFMETDIILTADDKVVCSHGWSQQSYIDTGVPYNANNPVMTYDQFMNTKIQGKFTTIDINTIVQYMKQHKDVYFEFDLRTIDKETAAKTTQGIVQAFGSDKTLLDRVIMQAGSNEMYEGIDSVYHFKYYQRFIHDNELKNIDDLLNWCKNNNNNITSIAVYEDHLTDEIIKKARQKGICVLTHTVDDVNLAKSLLAKGVDLVCTNFITYSDLEKTDH